MYCTGETSRVPILTKAASAFSLYFLRIFPLKAQTNAGFQTNTLKPSLLVICHDNVFCFGDVFSCYVPKFLE